MVDGDVYLNQSDIVRLLEEEIRKTIEKRLASTELSKLPPQIVAIAEKLKALAVEKIGTPKWRASPKWWCKKPFPHAS